MTTTEMWAVFDPNDRIIYYSIDYRECTAISNVATELSMWSGYYVPRDYTCRRVKVTIEEIKNE